MIPTSKADAFMDKLINLVNSDFKTAKDMDVVLLLGGTGSGKSTTMNMIAGSKIHATVDDQDGQWKFKATPEIAFIGHDRSMTFIPNYWEGKSIRIYDCPGFNDNRSIEHEIVKSFFIKEIASSARSIKVIIVGDVNCVYANRCGPFEDCFKQMKQLINNFNPNKDCSLIVTKALPRHKPKHIQSKFSETLKIQIPLDKIMLVYQPQDNGEFDYSQYNFHKLIQITPTLRENCNVPLSSEAKLNLLQISSELNKSIEKATAIYSDTVRRYYIDVLTLTSTSMNNAAMKQLYNVIVSSQNSLKVTGNPQQFMELLKRFSLKIQQAGKSKFSYNEIYQFIVQKYNQISYLKDKIDNFDVNMNYWIQNIKFQCELFEKSLDQSKIKDNGSLKTYLLDNLKIDINSNIKVQAHASLNKFHSFSAQYSGSKTITGSVTHSNSYNKKFNIPYVAEVSIGQSVPYSGSVRYSGSKEVDVSVSVKRCCCTSFFTPNGCLSCDHSYFDLTSTRTAYYDDYVSYSGSVYYSGKESKVCNAQFMEVVNQYVKKNYQQSVPYSGNHTANCRQHHDCSCERLADIVIAAKETIQDMEYYRKIINTQRKEICRLKRVGQQPNENSNNLAIQGEFTINGYEFVVKNLTKKIITQQIHDQLTKQFVFLEPYRGETTFKIAKPYNESFVCQGTKTLKNELTHRAQVCYSGSAYYSKANTLSGSLQAKSCYQDCSWCTVSYWQESFSKSYSVSGYQPYSGVVSFNKPFPHSYQLKYNETIPYSGMITKDQRVVYEGMNEVKCESSKSLGSGHHSCTSCDAWERFVGGLKSLLEMQSQLMGKIESNKQEIRRLIANQEQKNRLQRQQLENEAQLAYK